MTYLLDTKGGCRVLVVDDDQDAADSLVEMLNRWGFSAAAVYDGAQAVLAEEVLQPSLVLIDIEMPDVDGYTAATAIRRGWPERVVKLVALTGRSSAAHIELSASVGFDEHICKPIGRARLQMLALEAGPPERLPLA